MAVVRLPSDRAREGDPRQVGFQDDPSPEHVAQAASAIRKLGDLVSMSEPQSARVLSVCFCHLRLPPRLPFNLFGFNILAVDVKGDVLLDQARDQEILYALIVNQPVELQREVAIAFLNDLVGRQAVVADVAAERRDLEDLPDLSASADAASADVSSETLRFSLKHAADELKTRAAGFGYRLEVRYQTDPLPGRDDVARRMRALRQLYNEQPDVRRAVDGTVSMIGGKPPMIRGGTEDIRVWAQQRTALLGVRQFMNQVSRDADVCGNGYLDFGFVGLDPTLRCLRPEAVVIDGPERYSLIDSDQPALDRVMHVRGLEQFSSPYGISPWEVLLYTLQRKHMIENVFTLARLEERAGNIAETKKRVARLQQLAQALETETKERLNALMWYPRKKFADIEGDLYFSGQELMQS